MKALKLVFLIFLTFCTWIICNYHRGVFPPPKVNTQKNFTPYSLWIPKSENQNMNHVVLTGTPFERGKLYGEHTKDLIEKQEYALYDKLSEFFPSTLIQQSFFVFLMRFFWGLEDYIPKNNQEEIYGVSLSTTTKLNFLADRFTRQIAYHGLHEVGQVMVDQNFLNFACTQLALPISDGFIIARAFDFEGGRIFDEQKIVKWVFPNQGIPYVSIIWAGMVGAVSGVNKNGVYIAMNAAGSDDFVRHGTPSTLILLKVLENAKNANEAKAIIANEKSLISEIFIVADKRTLLHIEKSPKRFHSEEITNAHAVTNHFTSNTFAADETNVWRMKNLTSVDRNVRGQNLVDKIQSKKQGKDSKKLALEMLEALRDKSDIHGKLLHLGHRKSIDALIATHGLIYNSSNDILYISEPPSLSGRFLGFDLKKSFEEKKPILVETLPEDKLVSLQTYRFILESRGALDEASRYIKKLDCSKAKKLINNLEDKNFIHTQFEKIKGDYYKNCEKNLDEAHKSYLQALKLGPEYFVQEKEIRKALE